MLEVFLVSFVHFWHAPLWVRSAKRRHQSPEWTILRHVICFVEAEVHWFQVLLGSLHPRSTGDLSALLQFSKGEAVKICLASDSSDIRAMWPNKESCRASTVAERSGSQFSVSHHHSTHGGTCHLIPNILRRHHWSRASILCRSILVTAQHSVLYRKMHRVQVLFSFSWLGGCGDLWLPYLSSLFSSSLQSIDYDDDNVDCGCEVGCTSSSTDLAAWYWGWKGWSCMSVSPTNFCYCVVVSTKVG